MQPGDTIPPFSRTGSFLTWSRFAAVNDEFALHHMDDDVAHHEGFAAAFAMAPLTFSYVQTMLRTWVGDRGRVESVEIRLRSPFLRDRTLTASGVVTSVSAGADGHHRVEADVWADDDTGTRLVEGRAVVVLEP
jgi:hypothetical protein